MKYALRCPHSARESGYSMDTHPVYRRTALAGVVSLLGIAGLLAFPPMAQAGVPVPQTQGTVSYYEGGVSSSVQAPFPSPSDVSQGSVNELSDIRLRSFYDTSTGLIENIVDGVESLR